VPPSRVGREGRTGSVCAREFPTSPSHSAPRTAWHE
jgi:hypothetical protein